MSMVCRFLVTSGLVMLGRFSVVACGVGMMFWRLLVMFRSFLWHVSSSKFELTFRADYLKPFSHKTSPLDGTSPHSAIRHRSCDRMAGLNWVVFLAVQPRHRLDLLALQIHGVMQMRG
jgi:hypothetical protein